MKQEAPKLAWVWFTQVELGAQSLWKDLGLGDLVFGLFGGKKSGGLSKAAIDMMGSAAKNPLGPLKVDGSYSTGLEFVPRNMVARIHRGEMILNRENADHYRAAMAERRSARVDMMATRTTRAATPSSSVNVTIHHYGDVKANNPSEYQAQMGRKAVSNAPRVARSEVQRGFYTGAVAGRRQAGGR